MFRVWALPRRSEGIITEQKRSPGAKSRTGADTRVRPPARPLGMSSTPFTEPEPGREPSEAAFFTAREICRAETKSLSAGEITVDVQRREVRVANAAITLTTLEFRILEALVRNAGRVLNRDFLTNIAMGQGLGAFGRSVDVHISNLRRKLGRSGAREQIKTVRGNGYMLASRRALDGAGT